MNARFKLLVYFVSLASKGFCPEFIELSDKHQMTFRVGHFRIFVGPKQTSRHDSQIFRFLDEQQTSGRRSKDATDCEQSNGAKVEHIASHWCPRLVNILSMRDTVGNAS